jgi:hypothetical protein
VTGKRKQRQE